MRAAASLPESARLVGINTSWMIALGWGMAAAIGSIAGMLIAPVVFLEPNMMGGVLIYGFAAAVLGGLTSPLGAVVGGFLVGVFENLAGTYIPGVGNELKLPIALALIITVLVCQAGWPVWPAHREASLIMSAAQETVTEAPAVEAVPKRAMTLGCGTSLAMLALLIIVPMFVKNFIVFQLTMLLIYAIAVLALNILTGGSGQFSLGQSAFYAVGAYTSAILMEHAGVNYALTLPDRRHHLLRLRIPVRPAGAAAERRLSGAGDLRAGGRDAATAEARLVRALDRRRAGPGGDQARCAVRPADRRRTCGCIISRWRSRSGSISPRSIC